MEKERRRVQYQKKSHHLRAQKQQRKEAIFLEADLSERTSQFTLNELTEFLETEYSQYLEKNGELTAKLNKAIPKQYYLRRQQWADYHKGLLFNQLQARGIPITQQNFKKMINGEYSIYKLNKYWLNFFDAQGTRLINFYHINPQIISSRPRNYTYKTFYVIEGTELQRAQIQNKGFKNNAIFMCNQLCKLQDFVNHLVDLTREKSNRR